MNNIKQRTITGVVYVLAVICAIIFSPYITIGFFGAVAMIALWEFYHNLKEINIHPNYIMGYAIAILFYLLFVLFRFIIGKKDSFIADTDVYDLIAIYAIIGVAFLFLLVFITFLVEIFRKKENPFSNIAYTLLGIVYIVLPMGLLNFLNVGKESSAICGIANFTPHILMGIFIIAWTNDTFAYLVGMKFGKHKFCERISPKKTWEGFLGGLLFSLIAGFCIAIFVNWGQTIQVLCMRICFWIGMALIISIIGTMGDLVESMFKRQLGIKDSGNILPGHGGMLDRFDIIFMIVPFVAIYLMITVLI